MTPARRARGVRLNALAAACLLCAALGAAGVFGWRWLAEVALGVPSTLESTENLDLVLAAVIPAVGNSVGYLLAYRPDAGLSLPLFLGPGLLLAGVGTAVPLSQLLPTADKGAIGVTLVSALISPTVTMTLLATRRNLAGARPASSIQGSTDVSPT